MYIEFKNSVDILARKIRALDLANFITNTLNFDNSNVAKRNKIKEWLAKGIEMGASHCLIIYDRWDYEDYPKYVMNEEELNRVLESFEQAKLEFSEPAEIIMEVYDLREDLYEKLYKR